MVTQIKCGIKAKRLGRSVLLNQLTTRSAVGAKIPRPSVSGFLPPPWTSWWVYCAMPTAHAFRYKRSLFLSLFLHSLCHVRNKVMYALSWPTVSALTQVLFWCLFPSLLRNLAKKHKRTISWALKQFVTRLYILFSIYASGWYIAAI